ncbi:MAG: RagB/SusD family nutrient uptake outer membrane protein [Bacteroidales bacterium]
MKTLRHIILIGISIIAFQAFYSCEEMFGDYLEKPPGVDVTEDTIFSSRINAETFLTSIYATGVESGYPLWDNWNGRRDTPFSSWTDEGENVASWYYSHQFNAGTLTPTSGSHENRGRWAVRFMAIRKIGIFLDRVDDVPDATQEWKDQASGQAMFIRALCYFDMFKIYGGVPLIPERLGASIDDPEAIKIPRSTVEETVNFIVEQCNAAAALLPDTWPTEDIGRATKGAALLLKAKTLLYAASPLSNTGDPVVSYGSPENNLLISYGNYDVNRWQLAADAAQVVIDWAPTGGKTLIDDRGVHPDWGVNQNYYDAWHEPDNVESIFAAKNIGQIGPGHTLWKGMNNFYVAQGGAQVWQNWVEKYEKRDGTPQTWDINGGNNLIELYNELDPRFVQSVAYVTSYWNPDFPTLMLWEGAVASNQPPILGNKTGYWQRKMVPPEMTSSVGGWPNWNILRLAEAYLIKAEALNEAQGPVQEAYDAVNKVRARSGMPDFLPGLSQEEFRIKIQNERSIELFAENNRLWDVMRWLIADKTDPVTGKAILNGQMYGIRITKQPDPSTEFNYEYKADEVRVWAPHMYHWPFMQNEVNKGYLIQNPGY